MKQKDINKLARASKNLLCRYAGYYDEWIQAVYDYETDELIKMWVNERNWWHELDGYMTNTRVQISIHNPMTRAEVAELVNEAVEEAKALRG